MSQSFFTRIDFIVNIGCLLKLSINYWNSFNGVLLISPGSWVFQHDMILNIPLITDLQLIHQRRQVIINERLRRINFRHQSYDYKYFWIILLLWMIVDEVLILLFKYMPMVQLLFNALCILQNELIFVVSNLFIGKRFSLKCGRVSNPAHRYRYI